MNDSCGLVLASGDAAGLMVPFKLPALVLGRGETADVQCDDLDPVHCLVIPTAAGPVMRAFSETGTRLNGAPVLAAMLHDGDELCVGQTTFTVRWPSLVPLTKSNEHEETIAKLTAEWQLQHAARIELQSTLDTQLADKETLLALIASDHASALSSAADQFKQKHGELETLRTQHEATLAAWYSEQEKWAATHADLQAQLSQKTIDRELFEIELAKLHDDQVAMTAARQELVTVSEALTLRQDELAAGHAALDAAKAEVAAKIGMIGEEHQKATEVHERTRAAASQYLREQRSKIQKERSEVVNQRIEVEAFAKAVQQKADHVEVESRRIATEVTEQNTKLQQAWNDLSEGHQKFEAERMRTESEWTAKARALGAREQDLAKREAVLQQHVTVAENRLNQLHVEIAGLEQRTTQARAQLAELESKRDSIRPRTVATPSMMDQESWTAPVPLNPKPDHRTANELMGTLRKQEHDLNAERQRLYLALRNVAAERETLHDRELRLHEERQRLEAAQHQWHAAEEQTVSELEHLAMTLSQRESRLLAMEKTWTATTRSPLAY